MKKIISFVKDSYNEMLHNVTWTKWKDLQKTAVLVLIAATIFALVIGLIDFIFRTILDSIYSIL